jgi:hypothetical protein
MAPATLRQQEQCQQVLQVRPRVEELHLVVLELEEGLVVLLDGKVVAGVLQETLHKKLIPLD